MRRSELRRQHKMLRFNFNLLTPTIQLAAAPKTCNFNPIRCSVNPRTSPAPRDRVVDFGKYRGKMLGSLPSPYLKWISRNLRAGDTEHWARLADIVLEDPVYKDRVEWEFAEKVLNGDVLVSTTSSVEALLEISERFGWDNDDKVGWSKVKFELLGTSRGGRIPRVSDKVTGGGGGGGGGSLKKVEVRRRSVREDVDRERRRKERRVRRVKGLGNEAESGGGDGGSTVVEIRDRFPGRESLLRKAMIGRGRDA